jgi:hypothetical protein
MTTEDMVRRALREEAEALAPSAWSAGPIHAAARARAQRRRARRVALAVAVAVAAPVAAVAVLAPGPGAVRTVSVDAPTVPAPSATHSDSSSPSLPVSRVLIVTDSQKVAIGHGQWLRLTAAESCQGGGGQSEQCSATANGNQAPDSVSLRISGDSDGTLFVPLYIGSGQAARITVTVAGRTYPVTVLTLPGHPGYATGYAWVPGGAGGQESATVYDAGGAVLARFAWG